MDKYKWLVKHLIWNGSRAKNNTYWIKIPKEDAEELQKEYPVCDTRPLSDIRLNVIKMMDNFIVLDTRI